MAKQSSTERGPSPKTVRRAYPYEVYAPGALSLEGVDLSLRANRETYQWELETLQHKLLERQIALFQSGGRAVLVFEGWDAAGKGGAIKRLTALMDPRGYKVWPIGAPNAEEARHHYLWRFWNKLPGTGELVVFDRSWYGRVLVERVERLARPAEWQRAYDEIDAFEKMLTDDGVRMLKFFLHIDKKTQLERFRAREKDPVKQYKIGPEDWRNRRNRRKYEQALQDVFDRTHRPDAAWEIIPANDKKHARLEVLRRTLALLS